MNILPMQEMPISRTKKNNFCASSTFKAPKARSISLDVIKGIARWNNNDVEEIFPILLSFGFGNNKLIQMISMINEISLRDSTSVIEIFKNPDWSKIQKNTKLPLFQTGLRLREILFAVRYPTYSQIKTELRQALRKINLPKQVSINAEELFSLEKNCLDFKVSCKNKEDFAIAGKAITALSDNPSALEIITKLNSFKNG